MPAGAYDDLIMDHIKNARGYRILPRATHEAVASNPLCGDDLTVYVKIENQRVVDVCFQCTCCGIAMASASMMCELAGGQTLAQLRTWLADISSTLVSGPPYKGGGDAALDALLKTIAGMPSRAQCAALPWTTLRNAINDSPADSA